MTTEQTDTLRERILRELEGYEPRVHDVLITYIVDEYTGDASTVVDLTLDDPPEGSETWQLDRLHEFSLAIERIVATEDLPSAVVNVTPVSPEEFEDEPTGT